MQKSWIAEYNCENPNVPTMPFGDITQSAGSVYRVKCRRYQNPGTAQRERSDDKAVYQLDLYPKPSQLILLLAFTGTAVQSILHYQQLLIGSKLQAQQFLHKSVLHLHQLL
jgi:hypothetical protein